MCQFGIGCVVRNLKSSYSYAYTEPSKNSGSRGLFFYVQCASEKLSDGRWRSQTVKCITWEGSPLFELAKTLQIGDMIMFGGIVKTSRTVDEHTLEKKKYYTTKLQGFVKCYGGVEVDKLAPNTFEETDEFDEYDF